MFGWCMSGHHKDCPVRIQKFVYVTHKVNLVTVTGVEHVDEWAECDCYCHKPKPVRKKK